MTNPTKLELLKTAILVEWIKGDRNTPRFVGSFFFGHYDEEGIAQSEDFASPDEIEEALRSLESEQLITGYHHDLASSRWFLNETAAVRFHTERIHDRDSLLHQIEKLGRDWVVEILENIQKAEGKTGVAKRKPSIGVVKSYPTLDDVPEFDSLADVDNLSEVERLSDIGAPASDRIVKRSDNEDAWLNAVEGAKELHDALIATNDHGSLSEDEFEQKLNEVRALQILLDSPQVQWDALNHFAEKTVKYLASKFADNAIGHAATALLGYLIALIQGAF